MAVIKIKTIKSSYQKYDEYIELINKDTAINYIKNNKRSTKQIELLNRLLNNEKILKKKYSLDIVKKLTYENIIKINKVNKYRINIDNNNVTLYNFNLKDFIEKDD